MSCKTNRNSMQQNCLHKNIEKTERLLILANHVIVKHCFHFAKVILMTFRFF